MFDRILLALDDPSDRDLALPLVRRLARAAGSRLIVLQSIPFLVTMAELPHELSPDIRGDDEVAEISVAALVEGLRADGIPTDGFTNVGRSAMMIAAAAERVEASLIVVAAPARPRFSRMLLDLTATPVCVVPRTRLPAGRPDRILVPIDGSDRSLESAPYAVALARAFGAGITFVHVGSSESAARAARDLTTQEAVPADVVIRMGDPAPQILEVCRGFRAGLIVMRSGSIAKPSSVAFEVLRLSPVPVMIVQQPLPVVPVRPGILLPSRMQSVPAALWTRRISSSPFEGVSEP